jgi:putative membrane-bound dehydrogenase-like protein
MTLPYPQVAVILKPVLALALVPVLLVGLAPPAPAQAPPPEKTGAAAFPSPADIGASLRLDAGLRAELVAAEPEIESPVAMAFDEEGRLWVVELRDYPHGPPAGQPPESRVKVLEDRDGDGRFETSTLFQDAISFANGVLPWRGGALVTAAPFIQWLQDENGDGKADRGEILFEGFAALNPQLRVSHPNLGLDGWVYVANGLRGGKVQQHGKGGAAVIDVSGMDFRFDPRDAGRHEAITGMGQFGLTFDDWGRRFVCDNRHHLRHIVMPREAIKRNPYLAAPALVQDISVEAEGELNSGIKIFPLSKNWTTSSLHVGRFTAACGVFVYRGDLLPETCRGAVFTCDPTGNLVHQEILEDAGATFRSRPGRAGVEFLASPDDRFRPVFLSGGPDGALYVVDMARAVIEHPEFMPVELKNRADLLVGKDRGRIWRIVPDAAEGKPKPGSRPAQPHLAAASARELVLLLGHRNAWWRATAQRLLLERNDPKALELLLVTAESAQQPLARLQAAWLLESFGKLDDDTVFLLSRSDSAGLRENAVRLAEPRLARSPALRDRVVALAADPDAKVRFQVALCLGGWNDDRIIGPLMQVARAEAGDRWTRMAVASAVPERAGELIAALVRPQDGQDLPAGTSALALVRELAAVAGARHHGPEVAGMLEAVLALRGPDSARWQLAAFDGLVEGLSRRGTKLADVLKALPSSGVSPDRTEQLTRRLDVMLGQATELANDSGRPTDDRVDAVRLLAQAPWPTVEPVLRRLLTGDPAPEVRLAAVRAAAAHGEPSVGRSLLDDLRIVTPGVRREIQLALVRRPERAALLLDDIETHKLATADLDPATVNLLMNSGRPELRDRARKLLKASLPEERRGVLERYRTAAQNEAEGDAGRGRLVFQQNCATCHNVAGIGVRVGPDIADTRVKTREQLLSDILNPNGAIDGNYLNYVVSTKSGQVFGGLIAAESASSLTLKRAEGQTDVVLRQDIDEIRSTGASLMPEGLEKNISVAEMTDLITFLKNWRYDAGRPPP